MKKTKQNKLIVTNDNQQISLSYQIKNLTHTPQTSEIAKFDRAVSEADKVDYLFAVGSALLTSSLDFIWRGRFSIKEANTWGTTQINSFVISIAKKIGCKGNDLESSIRFLEKQAINPADKVTAEFGRGLQHHLRDFSHHFSIVGLFFSILTQFTKKAYGTNTNGDFVVIDLPDDAHIGINYSEKIYFATIEWVLHLVSDMAGSSSSPGKGTGIPGPILSGLKELSSLPTLNKLKLKYKDEDISLSTYISKLFNGTAIKEQNTNKGIRFDLRTELGICQEAFKQSIAVLINESIIRAFYFVRRLLVEIQTKEILNISDISLIDFEKVLPFNNRTITRMNLVSSSVFVTVSTTGAALRAKVISKGNKEQYVSNFILSLNYIGIGKFLINIKNEAKYISKDFKVAYKKFAEKYNINLDSILAFLSKPETIKIISDIVMLLINSIKKK